MAVAPAGHRRSGPAGTGPGRKDLAEGTGFVVVSWDSLPADIGRIV